MSKWPNQDTIGERGGMNLYGFVGNDPISHIDLFGLAGAEDDVDPENFETPEQRDADILERIVNGGHETAEEMNEDRDAWQAYARANGLDPNQSYIGPRPEDSKPETRTPCPPKSGVYALVDPNSRIVMRTGRTGNLEARGPQLRQNPDLKGFEYTPVYRTDNYAEQRGLEQILNNRATAAQGFPPPFNYIQPISPGNPNYLNYRGLPITLFFSLFRNVLGVFH